MKYMIKKPDTFFNMLNEDINSILHKSFDNIFPEYFLEKEINGFAMPVDIKEYDDHYKVRLELPGIKKENINIEINKSSLKIDAKREIEVEENERNHKYHKSEFRYGNYSRTLYFPEEINTNDAEAKLKNGVLCLYLKKTIKDKEKNFKLEIKD